MTYKAQCERCGDSVDEPMLMGQFHEDEFMTTEWGDRLKDVGFDLQDTITFCADCTYTLLVDDA